MKREMGKVEGDFSYHRDCLLEFYASGDAIAKGSQGAAIRIEDGSATWTLDIPDAFAPRAMTLLSPRDGILRGGQPVVIRWSPASDRIDGREIGFELRDANTEPGKGTRIGKVDVVGDQLTATVPREGLRSRGPTSLIFRGTMNVKPALSPCPVSNCSVSLVFSVSPLAVTVEP